MGDATTETKRRAAFLFGAGGSTSEIRGWRSVMAREGAKMPRNIEIKAKISSIAALAPRVAEIASQGPTEMAQDDTFFACPTGRLKLRAFSEREGELIFYRRADERGPKESFYVRARTDDPDAMRECLSQAWGQLGRVRKRRTVYWVGRTRIHLDRVAGLGEYLELEVVLEDDEPAEAGAREARAIMARLGIEPTQLVEGAYLDLLRRAHAAAGERTGATH